MYPICDPNRFDFIIRLNNYFNNFLNLVELLKHKILSFFNPLIILAVVYLSGPMIWGDLKKSILSKLLEARFLENGSEG